MIEFYQGCKLLVKEMKFLLVSIVSRQNSHDDDNDDDDVDYKSCIELY